MRLFLAMAIFVLWIPLSLTAAEQSKTPAGKVAAEQVEAIEGVEAAQEVPDEFIVPAVIMLLGGVIALGGFVNPILLVVAGGILLLGVILILLLFPRPNMPQKKNFFFIFLLILLAILMAAFIVFLIFLLVLALALILAGALGTAATLPWIGLGITAGGLIWLLIQVIRLGIEKKKKIHKPSNESGT